jgi:hypothetical protein
MVLVAIDRLDAEFDPLGPGVLGGSLQGVGDVVVFDLCRRQAGTFAQAAKDHPG